MTVAKQLGKSTHRFNNGKCSVQCYQPRWRTPTKDNYV